MRSRSPICFAAILLVGGLASAELPENWQDYFEGPAGFLLTKKEKKEWKNIDTAAQAEQFLDLFWAKRDPNLETPLNEFKEDFELRVAAADEAFGMDGKRGALTDRGKVLILLGRPVQRLERAPQETTVAEDAGLGRSGTTGGFGVPDAGGEAGGSPPGAGGPQGGTPPSDSSFQRERDRGGNIEIWAYDPKMLPVAVPQKRFVVGFQERRLGEGDFYFNRSHPANETARRVIDQAPEALLRHPDLEQVPRFGLIQGTEPATEGQLAWFGSDPRPWPDGAAVVAREGLFTGPRHFIWAHLHLPAGAPAEATAVGQLRNADTDEVVGSFQLELEGSQDEGGRGYELSVPVASGRWTLDLALADAGRPLAVTELTTETTDLPLDQTVFSPFLWGTEVAEAPDTKLGDPFNIGGWHVVPHVDPVFQPDDEIVYMTYILQPKLTASGQPDFKVTLALYSDGKRLVRGNPQPAQLSQVAPDMWMFGGSITLSKFREPGEYELKVSLEQVADGAEHSVQIPFTLEEVASSGG